MVPHQDTRLGVNARIMTEGQSVSVSLCNVKMKLQKAFQSFAKSLSRLAWTQPNVQIFCSSLVKSQVQQSYSSPESQYTVNFPNRSFTPSTSWSPQMPVRSCWTQVPLSHCVKKAPNTLLRCHRTSE